ncbi:MAG: restriction endonuclease subunit S [Bacteroidota bacterium]
MEVKEGYKQTDMGLIPLEWDVKEFEEVMDGFSSGQTPYRAIANYYKGDIPWVTSGELNYNVITETVEKISIEGVRAANLKMIPKGTFLFAITGLEAAGTRGSCAITGIEVTTNQSCMALYPKKNLLIIPYLYHYYVKFGNELAFEYCQGTKQQSYTGAIAKKLPIIVPPSIEEQTAIATALSDADALITSLEKLVEKKRAIKQGAMQKLLKSKEGWVTKTLGEIGVLKNGINKASEDFGFGYPFVNLLDVFGETKISTNEYLGLINSNVSERKMYNLIKGDVLFIRSSVKPEGVGLTCVIDRDLENTGFSGFIIRFRDFGILSDEFKEYCFYSYDFRNSLIASSSVSANTNINQESLKKLSICYPESKSEQTHIASIISDMDTEITIMAQKLVKCKMLKQGMMQELLTGKTRLV